MKLKEKEVLEQSKNALRQWEEIWHKNAKENNKIYLKSHHRLTDYLFKGAGRQALVCAMGHSFEKNLELIQGYKDNRNFDIICVDKCLKYLGFAPDYVIVADAQVSADYIGDIDTSKSTLIMNICGNPDWAKKWQGPIVFYVNKDNIKTELMFGEGGGSSDVKEQIPAASNVGNAAVVISSLIFSYDKIMLLGYDFCFSESYYAFHTDHPPRSQNKKYWMNHRTTLTLAGDIVKTSENLLFSSRWLSDFAKTVPGKIFNTSYFTISNLPVVNIEQHLKRASIRKIYPEEKLQYLNTVKKRINISNPDELNKVLQENSGKILNINVEVIPGAQSWLSLAS